MKEHMLIMLETLSLSHARYGLDAFDGWCEVRFICVGRKG